MLNLASPPKYSLISYLSFYMLMHGGSLGGKCLCIATVCGLLKTRNQGCRVLIIHSPHSLLYLSVCGCVHIETLLCHVSARREFHPDLCWGSHPGNVGLQSTNTGVSQLREEDQVAVRMSPCPESLPSHWLHAWDSFGHAALSCFDFFPLKTFPSTRHWQRKYFPVQK